MLTAAGRVDDAAFAGGSTHGASPDDLWAAMLDAAPIAPAIPALTDEDVRTELTRQYDEGGGAHFLKLADWAYALAAERAGVRIK